MAWSPHLWKRELLVENHGTQKKPRYKLVGMIRITTPDGSTYLEPIPNGWYWQNLEFQHIDFVTPHSTRRDAGAGELNLTGSNNAYPFGGREA
jgi:hypothetical protein